MTAPGTAVGTGHRYGEGAPVAPPRGAGNCATSHNRPAPANPPHPHGATALRATRSLLTPTRDGVNNNRTEQNRTGDHVLDGRVHVEQVKAGLDRLDDQH